MGIGRINQNVFTGLNESGTEVTSTAYYPHPSAHRAWVHLLSTDAGTLDLDVLLSNGTWAQKSTHAATANTLLSVELTYVPVALRARFTPGAALGGVVIDAGYSGGPVS